VPTVPNYIHRLAEGVRALQTLPSEWVDRRSLEETLGVSKWTAWRILKQCGAEPGPGGALMCRRADLIERLQRLEQYGPHQAEIDRRTRVERYLSTMIQFATSKHTEIVRGNEATLALLSSRFNSLPPGVELTPTKLTIAFHGTEDFLHKVGALVYTLQNDFEAVRELIDANTTDTNTNDTEVHRASE
jgi:hypothetical protein